MNQVHSRPSASWCGQSCISHVNEVQTLYANITNLANHFKGTIRFITQFPPGSTTLTNTWSPGVKFLCFVALLLLSAIFTLATTSLSMATSQMSANFPFSQSSQSVAETAVRSPINQPSWITSRCLHSCLPYINSNGENPILAWGADRLKENVLQELVPILLLIKVFL